MHRDDYLPISTIEKLAFCTRQAYLHHREREDAENALIAEGKILHRRVTEERTETRGSRRTSRSCHLVNHALGIVGIADVVESRNGTLFPVEYKHGRGKMRLSQHIQLGLQALCLEEMLETRIPHGAIYHGGTRRRETVAIDDELRARCRAAVSEARAVLASERPPAVVPIPGCRACSLKDICLPAIAGKSAKHYLAQSLEEQP